MSLDGMVIRSLVHELQWCTGGRIHKIYQPSAPDIVMQIRAQNNTKKLIISANATYPRVHFSNANFLNPQEAPMFCMLLRKYCEGGIIESITQIGMERIIHMDIRHRDELGDISLKRIIIEMMGRHSNIILMDPSSQLILDGIQHVTPAVSSFRVVLPGSRYVLPPDQYKLHPLEVSFSSFIQEWCNYWQPGNTSTHLTELSNTSNLRNDLSVFEKLLQQPEPPNQPTAQQSAQQWIVDRFSGISPLNAKEMIYRSQINSIMNLSPEELNLIQLEQEGQRLWEIFHSIMEQLIHHQYEPTIIQHPSNGKFYYSIISLTHLQGSSIPFEGISACLEAYYGDKAERDTVKQRVSDVNRLLHNEKTKNEKKLEKLKTTLEEVLDADKYRKQGELLTASLHILKKGATEAEVMDYYDPDQNTIKIPLDPLLTPVENAQRYYKRYTKSKNSQMIVEEQIRNTKEEIIYIQSIQSQLTNAGLSDIEEIRTELVEGGYIRARVKKGKIKKKPGKPSVTCYQSSEGIPIYVGKNNIQNDYISNRLASPHDTWLHTKDIPGSHVVIRSDQFSDVTLHEAAQLAAYFSQARESSAVPVDYTLIRYVRKPSGAKPGYVIYDHQKTLFITPDESSIKALPLLK